MYNNFVENKLLLANKLMCDALIFSWSQKEEQEFDHSESTEKILR